MLALAVVDARCARRLRVDERQLAEQAHRLQVGRRRRPSLELPPDLTTPQYDDRYAVTHRHPGSPRQSADKGRSSRISLPHDARRARSRAPARALAGRQRHARAGVDDGARVLAGERLRARASSSRARHHGNRLGREPRRDPAGLRPQHVGKFSTSSTRRTSATSSARASSAAPSPARSRSTSRIAAWSRCRRQDRQLVSRPASRGP